MLFPCSNSVCGGLGVYRATTGSGIATIATIVPVRRLWPIFHSTRTYILHAFRQPPTSYLLVFNWTPLL